MQFDSQTTQYISTNFFEEKSTDEEGYKSVVRIFDTIIIFPFATFLVVSYIAFIYSYRIVIYAIEYIEGNDCNNDEPTEDTNTLLILLKNILMRFKYKIIPDNRTDDDKKHDRKIRKFALSLASMFLSLALIAFHAFASMEVIKYDNEVLYDKDDDFNSNAFGNVTITVHHGSDDQCLPIIYVVISFCQLYR